MTRPQIIASTTALLAAVSIAAPSLAEGGSLLSGYGGPGQGNQAILGSALLNGPGGGGGGGSGSSTGEAKPGLAASSLAEATSGGVHAGRTDAAHAGTGAQGARATGRAATGGGGKAGGSGQAGKASAGAAEAYLALEHGEARAASDGLETFGLSARDLLYLVSALGLLFFTGMVTRRLTGLTATRRHG
jgi:hypothetical protein